MISGILGVFERLNRYSSAESPCRQRFPLYSNLSGFAFYPLQATTFTLYSTRVDSGLGIEGDLTTMSPV